MDDSETRFAPADRDDYAAVETVSARILSAGFIRMILNALSEIALVLNDKRQVVFANDVAVAALGLEVGGFLGLRPGELLGCVNARRTAGGCGTTASCRYCGAIAAILDCGEIDGRSTRDCRLTVDRDGKRESLDLLVTAKKIQDRGWVYTMITLHDIGDAKRRQVLERIFFHDVINSISAVQGGALLLKEEYGANGPGYVDSILASTEHLLEEVLRQRDFLSMERGDLTVTPRVESNKDLLRSVVASFSASRFAKGKILRLDDGASAELALRTDPVLLRRVLGNMVKNALEASEAGDEVRAWTGPVGPSVRFSVRNPAVMGEEVRLQVFQRSFSTKGAGRGIGTYSMRMLARDYLGGDVGFSSEPGEGTTFWVDLPADAGAQDR